MNQPAAQIAGPDLIDRRQRLAACMLLSAMDLPAPAGDAARQLIEAADVCPGVTIGDLPPLGPGSRRLFLQRASDLIDEMLAELAE